MIEIGCAPARKVGRTLSPAQVVRKVALYGTHSPSLVDAPWGDDSWEHWGHASGRAWYSREMDRYFDVHPKSCWSRGGKKTALYPKWLAMNTVPIYMQSRYAEVPGSVKYPRGRILTEFSYAHGRHYFGNQAAWMIALALTEGVTRIGLYGIEYGIQSEYQIQRGSMEYWLGVLDGRGVEVILPEQCTLLAQPKGLYGYESHDEKTAERLPEYLEKTWKRPEITPLPAGEGSSKRLKPPPHVVEAIALEEAEYLRPDWALGPIPPGGGNGEAQKGSQ